MQKKGLLFGDVHRSVELMIGRMMGGCCRGKSCVPLWTQGQDGTFASV